MGPFQSHGSQFSNHPHISSCCILYSETHLISDTNTPMLGCVEQIARADTNLARNMIGIDGDTAIRHQLKNNGIPAIMVTCLRPNFAERYPPTMQAGSPAIRYNVAIHEASSKPTLSLGSGSTSSCGIRDEGRATRQPVLNDIREEAKAPATF